MSDNFLTTMVKQVAKSLDVKVSEIDTYQLKSGDTTGTCRVNGRKVYLAKVKEDEPEAIKFITQNFKNTLVTLGADRDNQRMTGGGIPGK